MLEIFLIIWLVIINYVIRERNGTKYYILMFCPFAILMGCRDISVGIDTYQYAMSYKEALSMSWSDIFSIRDPAWLAMQKLTSYVYADYYFWQCIFATIYLGIYSLIIRKYCSNKLLATVVFLSTGLYTYAFNISRQMLSISFFIISWDLLTRNKIKQSIFLYCLSLLTHLSSIVAFPILLLTKIKINKHIEKVLPLIIVLVLCSFNILLQQLGFLMPQYETYLDNTRELHGGGFIKILWAIELIFSLYIYYFSSNATKIYKVSAIGIMIYIGTTILGFSFNYAERIGYVFLPFVLLIFDRMYLDIKNITFRKLLSFFEIICFMCFFYLAIYNLQIKFFFE